MKGGDIMDTVPRYIIVKLPDDQSKGAIDKLFPGKNDDCFHIFDTNESETIAICFCAREKAVSMAYAMNTFHKRD